MVTTTAPSSAIILCHRLSPVLAVVAAVGTLAGVPSTFAGIGLETGGGTGAVVGGAEGRSGGSVAARFMQSLCSGTRMSGPKSGSWRQVGVESSLTHCPASSSSSSTSARQACGCSPSRALSEQV